MTTTVTIVSTSTDSDDSDDLVPYVSVGRFAGTNQVSRTCDFVNRFLAGRGSFREPPGPRCRVAFLTASAAGWGATRRGGVSQNVACMGPVEHGSSVFPE